MPLWLGTHGQPKRYGSDGSSHWVSCPAKAGHPVTPARSKETCCAKSEASGGYWIAAFERVKELLGRRPQPAPSPRLPLGRLRPSLTGYGEGWGEGAGHKAQTPGEPPSPRPSPPLGTMRGERREGAGACGRLHLYDRVPWARQSHGAVDDADHRVGWRKIAPRLAARCVRVLPHQAAAVSCPP